jgi:hypothetical protein
MLSHKKYSNILDYLAEKDSKSSELLLYRIITNLGISGLFKPYKNGQGLTFLIPDKALSKTIIDLYNKDELDEIEKIFKSLLITFYLPSLHAFDSKKDDLSNKLRCAIPVKEVKKDQVVLENGSVIRNYDGFKSGKSNVAVYLVEGGSLPLEGPPAKNKYNKIESKNNKAIVKGGCELKNLDSFTREMEIRYFVKSREAKKNSTSRLLENPYLEVVASFLNYLKNSNEQRCKDELNVIMSIIDTSPETSYYLIFEPYNNNNKLVSNETIQGFVKNAFRSVSLFKDIYNSSISVNNREQVCQQICDLRSNILHNTTKISITKAIHDAYNDLYQNNSIGSCHKVYSDEVFSKIRERKFWQDSLRFFLRRSISSYWETPGLPTLEDFINTFLYCVCKRVNGENYSEQVICYDVNTKDISDDIYYTIYRDFVRSDYFLYIPFNEEEMKKQPCKEYGSPDKNTQIRYAYQEYQRIDHYIKSEEKKLINDYVLNAIKLSVNDENKYNQIVEQLIGKN